MPPNYNTALMEEIRARQRLMSRNAPMAAPIAAVPANPFAPEPSFIGGFLKSALSALPEMVGYDPTPEAVTFRSANPVSGFASQVIPMMGPYGAMFKLSKTATGAAALQKGMSGAKATGKALGFETVGRPIIARAVKETLRYSPLELGRLGVGAAINPENSGELLADVALSMAFEGTLGLGVGFLKAGGVRKRALGGSKIEGQDNIFAHPVVDLRAARLPEAKLVAGVDDTTLEAEIDSLTRTVLNDKGDKTLSGQYMHHIPKVLGDATGKITTHINALLKPNSRGAKDRELDKRKFWEGDPDDNTTLNPGELQDSVAKLGFTTPTELAENTLVARHVRLKSDRAAGQFNKLLESPALVSVGDGQFMIRTETGATVVIKKLREAEDLAAAPKPGKIDDAVDPPSPVDEAAANLELPPVDERTLLDAGASPLQLKAFAEGKLPTADIEKIRQGHFFWIKGPEPVTDDVLANLRSSSDARIEQLRAKIRTVETEWKPGEKRALLSDGKRLTKEEAALDLNRQIEREMDSVTGLMRQNERWKFSQNNPVPTPTPKPATAKRKKKISPQVSAPPAPTGPFKAGQDWALILTDRPGAHIKSLEKLNVINSNSHATLRRMFQPIGHEADEFSKQDDILLSVVQATDVTRMSKESRKTWVAEQLKSWKDRGVRLAGLEDSYSLQHYADKLYEAFAPSMFKERRNTLFARYSGLLQNRYRHIDDELNAWTHGKLLTKPGARGVTGGNFERSGIAPDGNISASAAFDSIPDEDWDAVIAALHTGTPAKDIKKLAKDGVISAEAVKGAERLAEINAHVATNLVIPAVKSVAEKANFNLLEGYVIPRIMPGDWRQKIVDESGRLVWLSAAESQGGVQAISKAIIDTAAERGIKYQTEASYLKTLGKQHKGDISHALESSAKEFADIMEDIGKRADADENIMDIVQSAMKRVHFVGVKKKSRIFNPRAPGSMTHERTGIPGTNPIYTKDEAKAAFHAHLTKMSRFAATHSYMERWGNELQALRGQNEVLYEDVMRRAQQALGVEGQITNTLNNILSPVLGAQMGSKAATKIAAATNKTLYAWQLGFVNPTFALLNSLSPLQTVLPHVAYMLRASSVESNRLMHYNPVFDDAGRPVAMGGVFDPLRILGESIRQLRRADPELQEIHRRLRNDNTITQMVIENHNGPEAIIPRTMKDAFQSGGYAEMLIKGSTAMARHSEEFARVVSANAGYLVGKRLGLADEGLYHFTKRFVESTNYLYGQSDRARLITGPVGSMFGLFKNWQMHFMGMMINYAGLAAKENVWSPLLWQMGAASVLGGLGATPLRNVADGLVKWHDHESNSYLWMRENLGSTLGNMVHFGPLGGLGVSLQASSTIPGTDVRNDLQMLTNSIVFERAAQVGKDIGHAYSYAKATGENPLTNSNVRDQLLSAFAPRAISRLASVAEGNYIKSMGTGYPQVQDPSFGSRMLHGLGLNATEIEQHQVAARQLYKDQEKRKAEITYHGKALAEALTEGDAELVRRIQLRAMARHLPLDSVYDSAATFHTREQGDLLSRYKGERSARYRNVFGQ